MFLFRAMAAVPRHRRLVETRPETVESLCRGLLRGDAASVVLRILEVEALCLGRRVCIFPTSQASTHPNAAPRRVQARMRRGVRLDRADRWLGIVHVETAGHWIAADLCYKARRVTLYDSLEWHNAHECCTARLSSDMRALRLDPDAPTSIAAYVRELFRLIVYLELYHGRVRDGTVYMPAEGRTAPAHLRREWAIEMRGHGEMQGAGECGIFALLLVQRLSMMAPCPSGKSWQSDIRCADAARARFEWYETVSHANWGGGMLEQYYDTCTPALVLIEVVEDHLLCGSTYERTDTEPVAMGACVYGEDTYRRTLEHVLYMHAADARIRVCDHRHLPDAFLVLCLTEREDVYERFMADTLPAVIRANRDPASGQRTAVTVVCGMRRAEPMAEAEAARTFPAMEKSGLAHLCRPWYIQVLSTYRKTAPSETGPRIETRLARSGGYSVEKFVAHPRPDLVYSDADKFFALSLSYMSIGFLYARVSGPKRSSPPPPPRADALPWPRTSLDSCIWPLASARASQHRGLRDRFWPACRDRRGGALHPPAGAKCRRPGRRPPRSSRRRAGRAWCRREGPS